MSRLTLAASAWTKWICYCTQCLNIHDRVCCPNREKKMHKQIKKYGKYTIVFFVLLKNTNAECTPIFPVVLHNHFMFIIYECMLYKWWSLFPAVVYLHNTQNTCKSKLIFDCPIDQASLQLRTAITNNCNRNEKWFTLYFLTLNPTSIRTKNQNWPDIYLMYFQKWKSEIFDCECNPISLTHVLYTRCIKKKWHIQQKKELGQSIILLELGIWFYGFFLA